MESLSIPVTRLNLIPPEMELSLRVVPPFHLAVSNRMDQPTVKKSSRRWRSINYLRANKVVKITTRGSMATKF